MDTETKRFTLKIVAGAVFTMMTVIVVRLIALYAKASLMLVLAKAGQGTTGTLEALFMTMGALLVPGAMAAWAALTFRKTFTELVRL